MRLNNIRPFCTTWVTFDSTPKTLLWAVYLRRMSTNYDSLGKKENKIYTTERKKGISPRNENYM